MDMPRRTKRRSGEEEKVRDAFEEVRALMSSDEHLRDRMAKSERIVFQVSPADKRSIELLASTLGLTMTEYLTRLHRMVAEGVVVRGGKERKKGQRRRNDVDSKNR